MLMTIPYCYWSGEDDEDPDGQWLEAELDINPFHIESVGRDPDNRKRVLLCMVSGDSFSVNMTMIAFRRAIKEFMAENVLQKIYAGMKDNNS